MCMRAKAKSLAVGVEELAPPGTLGRELVAPQSCLHEGCVCLRLCLTQFSKVSALVYY